MKLPSGFNFTQSSLEDYIICPRRFELRHILHIKWPALYTESYLEQQKFLKRGNQFHQIAHQHFLGLEKQTIQAQILDLELEKWFDNFLQSSIFELQAEKLYPEITLQQNILNVRMIAKFDLIITQANHKIIIVDWKTTQTRPPSQTMINRMQSRVYPFVAVYAGHIFYPDCTRIEPYNIQMIYWFANHPESPEIISYNNSQYDEDKSYLSNLIEEILNKASGQFPLTEKEKNCKFCNFRSLCSRCEKGGEWDSDAEISLEWQLDQLSEELDEAWIQTSKI